MEKYKVLIKDQVTVIALTDQPFKVNVVKNRKLTEKDNGALLEATHYKEDSVFINNGSYIFELVNQDDNPIRCEVDLALFHDVIDFFFKSILDTEYFVKSTPHCSILYKGNRTPFVNGSNSAQ